MSGDGYLMKPMPVDANMSLIGAPDLGGAPASPSRYYAFNTDSSRALIMLFRMSRDGAKIYRTVSSFTLGGRKYPTGTAIVDGSTVVANNIDLENYGDTYQTRIAGLSAMPAGGRYLIKKPKVGMLTGTATATLPPAGVCSIGTTACQAMFTLREKMGLTVDPITTTDLANGVLSSGNYTAVVNPATTVAAGPGATALQTFVNNGGSYFGWGTGGVNSARNAGMTNVNTTTNGPTQGVVVKASYNTNSPLSWGFDNGGFLYRVSGAVTLNPATLPGNGGAITDATESISYPNPTLRFSYATGMSNLYGKTAATDQAFGSGRVTLLSIDPTFRSWLESAERLIMNGILYPTSPMIVPMRYSRPMVLPANEVAPGAGRTLPRKALPAVRNRPANRYHDPSEDLRIKVSSADADSLKRFFEQVAPAGVKKIAKFVRGNGTVTLVVVNGHSQDGHFAPWVNALGARIKRNNIGTLLVRL